MNDGACMLLLMSEKGIIDNGIKPEFEILGFADSESAPLDFNLTPTLAAKKAIKMAGLTVKDIDFWEINEAFSVTALVNKM